MTLAYALAIPALVVAALGLFIHDLLTDLQHQLRKAEVEREWDETATFDELYPQLLSLVPTAGERQ